LTEIAIVPAAPRTCQEGGSARGLDSAAVLRCIDALNALAADGGPVRTAESAGPEPTTALATLRLFLARIEDNSVHVAQQTARVNRLEEQKKGAWSRRRTQIEGELSRAKFDLDMQTEIAVPPEGRAYCAGERVDLADRESVRVCVNNLRAAVDGGGYPAHPSAASASADGDHVLDRKIASYQDLAAERAARIGARVAVLDKKIPDASADEKPKLEAERKALQAELDSLVQAGIAAGGRYDCDDP